LTSKPLGLAQTDALIKNARAGREALALRRLGRRHRRVGGFPVDDLPTAGRSDGPAEQPRLNAEKPKEASRDG
jgi:hypothetical protein